MYNLAMPTDAPNRKQALWLGATVVAFAVAEAFWSAGIFVIFALILFFSARLGARTIHAFIQGVNEGDDPRFAKRPPDDP